MFTNFIIHTYSLSRRLSLHIKSSGDILALVTGLNLLFPKKIRDSRLTFGINLSAIHKKLISTRNEILIQAVHQQNRTEKILFDTEKSVLFCKPHFEYLFPYRNTEIKASLLAIKRGKLGSKKKDRSHVGAFALAESFSDELIAHISDCVGRLPIAKSLPYLTHVPSSSYALGRKNFDHMEILLTSVEQNFSAFFTLCTNVILIKPQATPYIYTQTSQHHLSRRDRFTASESRFCINKEFLNVIYSTSILYCIDDITTTGATFTAIQKLLSETAAPNTLKTSAFLQSTEQAKNQISTLEKNYKNSQLTITCIALAH
jgi:predicted amidophosphoribosyltransferase